MSRWGRIGEEKEKKMTDKEICDAIGKGMTLSIPHNKQYPPKLIDSWAKEKEEEDRIKSIILSWSDANRFLTNMKGVIAKAEKEDIHQKRGWKSMGWDGESYDYYRMVQ